MSVAMIVSPGETFTVCFITRGFRKVRFQLIRLDRRLLQRCIFRAQLPKLLMLQTHQQQTHERH